MNRVGKSNRPRGRRGRAWTAAVLLLGAVAVGGCSSVGYYAQAVQGHMAMLAAARPIDDWIADAQAPGSLKERLLRAREIRAYASRELGLPDNRSYTEYADLGRPAVVWNVFATPALSLELKSWCYLGFGCAGYRGYFNRADADHLAGELRAQGYDVNVAPVPAYSTLGWFSDPLLNTFIHAHDGELARLVFHELAHQVAYAKDDTVFNESFATTVEREGVRRWLATNGDPALREGYTAVQRRRTEFLALLRRYRSELQTRVYRADVPRQTQESEKQRVFTALRADYRQLRDERWGGWRGYDHFFAQDLNNAHLAAVGAYNDLVPAFEALLARLDGDLPRFYREVARLATLEPVARNAALKTAQ